jgi:hypothetical protein
MAQKFQFVSHWPNMFEDLIGDIKLERNILVVVVFEGGMLIRLQTKEHLIHFFNMAFRTMLLILLLHLVLIHYQIILKSVENVSPSYEEFFYLLHLRDFR